MGSIEPVLWRDLTIILIFVGGFILRILTFIQSTKRKPSVGEDLGTINTRVEAIETLVKAKQDSANCRQLHERWASEMDDIQERHASHEEKISRQIGDVHARIDRQTAAIAANGGKLETFMSEIRDWRNNHAKNNHT